MPTRIQRRRTKGWRKPDNCVIVTRPSRFGNPFALGAAEEHGGAETPEDARKLCLTAFRSWLGGSETWWMGPQAEATRQRMLAGLPELRGKDLACYCPLDQPCHADLLLSIANAPVGAGMCERCWQWDANPSQHQRCAQCGRPWSRIVSAGATP